MSVTLAQILEFEEGLRLEPYVCPAGHWTIGVGWNLEAHGLPAWLCKEFFDRGGKISRKSALQLLDASIRPAIKDAEIFVGPHRPAGYTDARRRAVQNMAFQLGLKRLIGFKNTRRFIQAGDWDNAASECLDSKWARDDSPGRAKRVARVFASGDDSLSATLYEDLL